MRPDIQAVGVELGVVGLVQHQQGVVVNQHAQLALPAQQIAATAQAVEEKTGILIQRLELGRIGGPAFAGIADRDPVVQYRHGRFDHCGFLGEQLLDQ